MKGDVLTVRMLNTSVVSKDIKTRAELAKAIEKNRDNPQLLNEPMVFKKIKAKK